MNSEDAHLALDVSGEVAGVCPPVKEQARGTGETVGHYAQRTSGQAPEVLVAFLRVREEALALAAEVCGRNRGDLVSGSRRGGRDTNSDIVLETERGGGTARD